MEFAFFTFLFGMQVGVIIGMWLEERQARDLREYINKLKELRKSNDCEGLK